MWRSIKPVNIYYSSEIINEREREREKNFCAVCVRV
jgi:hypothetical protein